MNPLDRYFNAWSASTDYADLYKRIHRSLNVGGKQANASEFEGKEFAAGVARGARSFRVDKLGRLTGVSHKQVWRPGENHAECRASNYEKDDNPVLASEHSIADCAHGFYGYYDGSDDYHESGMVSGVVEGYGEAVIGSRGFRCMKARIVAIHIPESVPANLRRLVTRNYPAIPVFEAFDRMVSEFTPDDGGEGITPESDPDFWTRTI